jgi:hypothetical protein
VFWKNQLNYVDLFITSIMEGAMKVIFMFYGKTVCIVLKKICRCRRTSPCAHVAAFVPDVRAHTAQTARAHPCHRSAVAPPHINRGALVGGGDEMAAPPAAVSAGHVIRLMGQMERHDFA